MENIFEKWVEERESRYDFICTKKDDFFREVKKLAFTFLRGIKDSKLTGNFKNNFRLENTNLGSCVSIANELGRDEIRITFVIGKKYGDWIVVKSLLNREKKRYWYIINEKDPDNSFISYDINEAIRYFETLKI